MKVTEWKRQEKKAREQDQERKQTDWVSKGRRLRRAIYDYFLYLFFF